MALYLFGTFPTQTLVGNNVAVAPLPLVMAGSLTRMARLRTG